METVLLASTAALLAAVAWPIATRHGPTPPSPEAATAVEQPARVTEVPAAAAAASPTIQIALLLDTSSSMSGLIDQARGQLWSVVNALDTATLHGQRPALEIALYEYGNTELSADSGFIRQVSPFTVELDRVAEALFELDTMGGSEHAGQVIARSIDELEWREDGLRVVYIAGNEDFSQGPVPWATAVGRARGQGVVVNTLNCRNGIQPDAGWEEAALLAGGRFLQIDHNAAVVHIAAPQDERIARLGEALNETYVGYGGEGRWGRSNQAVQDANASKFGLGTTVQRAVTKSSQSYRNPSWDLVDALEDGTITLAEVDRESLPAEAQALSGEALDAWIDGKRARRVAINQELVELARARAEFVAEQRAQPGGPERLDTAIVRSIVEQARAAGFIIEPVAR